MQRYTGCLLSTDMRPAARQTIESHLLNVLSADEQSRNIICSRQRQQQTIAIFIVVLLRSLVMATAVYAKYQLDKLVEHSDCSKVHRDPCVQSGSPQYSAGWVEDTWQENKKTACQLCGQHIALGPDDEGGKPTKSVHKKKPLKLKINQSTRPDATVKLCDICSTEDGGTHNSNVGAEVFCLECQQSFCRSCMIRHVDMAKAGTHTVVQLKDHGANTNEINFKMSSTFRGDKTTLEIYCCECKTTMCWNCYTNEHSSHEYSDATEMVREFRENLTHGVERMSNAMSRFDEKLDKLKSARKYFGDRVEKVRSEICETADRLKAIIDAEKQRLVDDLYEMKANHEEEMEDIAREITRCKSLIRTLEERCDELMKRGTANDVIGEFSNLLERTEEMIENAESIEDAVDRCIEVDITIFPPNTIIDGTTSVLGRVIKEGACQPMGSPILAHTQTGNTGILAIALLKNHLFVTCSGVAGVSIYDKTSVQLQRQLVIQGLGIHLPGLATCSGNNCLYVADYSNRCVHRVDLSITDIKENVTEWSVSPNDPRGLSVNSSRNVLVTCGTAKKVQEYTPSGSLVREVFDSNCLWQAVQLSRGTWAVSRWGPVNGIATTSTDGQLIMGYQLAAAIGPMNYPRCIAIDKHDFILVADYHNNRILVANPSLTEYRQLPLPVECTLRNPLALCLDQSRGRLYIGEFGGEHRLLVFDGVINVRTIFNNDMCYI